MHPNTRFARPLMPAIAAALALGLHASTGAQEAPSDEVVVIGSLMWALETSGAVPWNEANQYCETLEAGGFTDWGLPTLVELEGLHDPAAEASIQGPFELDDCCAWSSMNLVDLEAETKGSLPEPGGPPRAYYWGFLFSDGIRYYSNGNFPDGFAMCRREPGAG